MFEDTNSAQCKTISAFLSAFWRMLLDEAPREDEEEAALVDDFKTTYPAFRVFSSTDDDAEVGLDDVAAAGYLRFGEKRALDFFLALGT